MLIDSIAFQLHKAPVTCTSIKTSKDYQRLKNSKIHGDVLWLLIFVLWFLIRLPTMYKDCDFRWLSATVVQQSYDWSRLTNIAKDHRWSIAWSLVTHCRPIIYFTILQASGGKQRTLPGGIFNCGPRCGWGNIIKHQDDSSSNAMTADPFWRWKTVRW